jgi:PAS domain S-box-containing protein
MGVQHRGIIVCSIDRTFNVQSNLEPMNSSDTGTPPTGEASPPRHQPQSLADVFLKLLDILDITIWELDLEYRIVACNEKAHSVYGDDIVGKHCYAITSGTRWLCRECPVQQVYQTNRPSRSEREHIDRAGRTIIVDHFATPIISPDDRLTGVVVMLVDITERRRLDQEVLHRKTRETETEWEKLIAAVQQTKDVIVITDRHGTIEFVNPAFTDVTGYSSKEAIGRNPRLLKSGKHDDSFYRQLWQTIGTGRTFQGRMINKKKDGTLYTEEATISPIFSPEGEITNYVGVKRDISEQLLLERQLHQAQKMEAIGRLTGGVAHDFNNILGVIIGYTDMALTKIAPSEPLHKELSTVLDAAERSATIVRQLLTFARRQTIAPVALDLNETVSGMLKMLQRLIGENIGLSWCPAANLPPVMMDPVQVDQILANLVLNAKDSMVDHGTITIETSLIYFDGSYCAMPVFTREHLSCWPSATTVPVYPLKTWRISSSRFSPQKNRAAEQVSDCPPCTASSSKTMGLLMSTVSPATARYSNSTSPPNRHVAPPPPGKKKNSQP